MLKQRGKGKIWWYRFKFGGRIIHESSRSHSRTVAREAEKQRRRQLEETWNKITKRTLPPTFEKAADDWYEAVKPHLAERTKDIYDVALRCHLKPALGGLLLCDVDTSAIASYQARRKSAKASARTLNKELQVLRQILKRHKLWANLQGDVRFERELQQVGKALSPDEESALLTTCEQNPLLRAVVTLALNTTMRDHEIKGLRWHQVDLFDRILTVGKSKTDAGTGRVIPLNPAAVRALADWSERFPKREPEHYVFPACENARIDTANPDYSRVDASRPLKSWRTAWRNATRNIACPKCGRRQRSTDSCRNPECKADLRSIKNPLAEFRFHDLRHCAITKLAESLASDQTVMAIAGHVSRQMLEHYSHIRIAAKRTALDAISTRLPEPAGGKAAVFEGEGNQKGNQVGMPQNRAVSNLLN